MLFRGRGRVVERLDSGMGARARAREILRPPQPIATALNADVPARDRMGARALGLCGARVSRGDCRSGAVADVFAALAMGESDARPTTDDRARALVSRAGR